MLLEVKHLKKRFGNQVVLDDININVDRGEVLCIIGQSGSGKTVLFRHIIGLLFPDGGEIRLDGQVVSTPTTKPADFDRHRKRFGILFQGAALFDSMNVGENLAFPLREHTTLTTKDINKTIGEALEMVGLKEEFKAKMPSELSGGMRSRVGLARAIVMKPEIMLYDEPTSALDPIMTDKINDLIISLKDRLNMTSIVISHDIGSAYKVADKIAMIHEGKIIFNGPSAEIRWSRNLYVQQFLRGYRERFYAFDQEDKYSGQADISKIKPGRPSRKGGAQQEQNAPLSVPIDIANKKFEMPARPR
ncbi:MAG: ABC transporter ATP-binding protein [Chitinispirillia bacterium]|nr:ABC transporter ATP-binding protein [Chitinispirillia bacterium]MCL2268003.1 ABC transporter ATP-binding protein [Chitinispirillia bacterium]